MQLVLAALTAGALAISASAGSVPGFVDDLLSDGGPPAWVDDVKTDGGPPAFVADQRHEEATTDETEAADVEDLDEDAAENASENAATPSGGTPAWVADHKATPSIKSGR